MYVVPRFDKFFAGKPVSAEREQPFSLCLKHIMQMNEQEYLKHVANLAAEATARFEMQ